VVTFEACLNQTGGWISEYNVHIRRWGASGAVVESSQLVHAAIEPHDDDLQKRAAATAEISRLPLGHGYSFRVQAAEGSEPRPMSQASDEVILSPGCPSAPGQPVAQLVGDAGSGKALPSVQLEWQVSETDGGCTIYGYRVHSYRLSPAALDACGDKLDSLPLQPPWVESSKVRGVAALPRMAGDKQMMQVVCSIDPGAPYCFEVQAINSQGTSAASPRSEVLRAPTTAPSACRGLVVRQVGPDEVCLSWQPPADSGGLPVTSYLVTTSPRLPGEAAGHVERASVSAEGQNKHWVRHIISRLQPGMEYAFGVSAVNSSGCSEEAHAPWTVLIPECSADNGATDAREDCSS